MDQINKAALRLTGVGVLAGAALLGYCAAPGFFQTLFRLLLTGDVASSIAFIKAYGPYAMAVSFGIVVLINAVAVLPNIFILAANGIIFGVVGGTVISWLAETVGVTISFIVLRYFFRDYAQQLITHSSFLKRIDQLSGRQGFRVMLVMRAIPYIPSGLISAMGALSSIRLRDYVLATLIGKLPSAWIEVTMGHDLLSYREHGLRLAIVAAASALAYYFFWAHDNKR